MHCCFFTHCEQRLQRWIQRNCTGVLSALAMRSLLTLSTPIQLQCGVVLCGTTNNELWRGRCLLCILDGFSCWKQSDWISDKWIRFYNLVFSWHELYARGIHIYIGSRKPTIKCWKLYPSENDFSEGLEVPRLNCNWDAKIRGSFTSLYFCSENSLGSRFCGACFDVG